MAMDQGTQGLRWIEVASFTREEEARLLAGRLQAEGIDAQVYPEYRSPYGEGLGWQSVGVMVPEHRILEARKVVEALDD